jgi:hypothetical protein
MQGSEVSGLVEAFRDQGSNFSVQLVRHRLVQSFLDENDPLTVNLLPSREQADEIIKDGVKVKEKFIETVQKLNSELETMDRQCVKLNGLKESYSKVEKTIDADGSASKNQEEKSVTEDIRKMEDILNQVRLRQSELKLLRDEKKEKNVRVRETLAIQSSSDTSNTPMSNRIRENRLIGIKEKLFTLQVGLEELSGVRIISMDVENDNENDETVLHLEIRKCVEAKIALDSFMTVIRVDILKSKCQIDSAKLLCEACILSPPQDLRYIIFVLEASQRAPERILSELNEVKKVYLVKRESSYTASVTFNSGISAALTFHEAYPDVVNSVTVTSLAGVGGWSHEELEDVRRTVNSRCLNSIKDVINDLNGDLES